MEERKRQELKAWLTKIDVKYKKLNKKFDDGVAVAKIIKKYQPRLVDLHNYSSCCGTEQKLNNWQTLNNKVLKRLGLQQTNAQLQCLARGETSVLEPFLWEIMHQEQSKGTREEKLKDHKKQVLCEDKNIVIEAVNTVVSDATQKVPQQMVPVSMYEKAINDSNEKDNEIDVAKAKIAQLESVLQLKVAELEKLKVEELTANSSE